MKVLLKKASDWKFEKIIEIDDSILELKKIYNNLIIDFDEDYSRAKEVDFVVTIYDDYVE
jgi:hypothetical protein